MKDNKLKEVFNFYNFIRILTIENIEALSLREMCPEGSLFAFPGAEREETFK